MTESWAQYVRRATAGTTQVQLALVTGVAQTAIGRWLRGDTAAPRAEWLASLIAWVRHGASAENVAIRLERSIALIVSDEN